jgi:hypothetical protein
MYSSGFCPGDDACKTLFSVEIVFTVYISYSGTCYTFVKYPYTTYVYLILYNEDATLNSVHMYIYIRCKLYVCII